ncbi:MAG: hypothetical protein AAB414_04120 [Patescibacteria group bacterium]
MERKIDKVFPQPTDPAFQMDNALVRKIDGLGMYASTVFTEVDRELKETPLETYERIFLSPFRDVLARHGYSEDDLQLNGPLDQESRAAASTWYAKHPDSRSADGVARLGLSAEVETHVKLLEERLEEVQSLDL